MTKHLALLLAGLIFSASALAAKDPVYSTRHGAIRGYDPVAYFTDSKPVKGRRDVTLEHNGATWRFASEKNRDLFVASPEKYAPQYGGYCAYAVGNGYTAKIDPEAWSIVDGKLYLNYSTGVQKSWEAKRDHYIDAGDRNWPGVLEK